MRPIFGLLILAVLVTDLRAQEQMIFNLDTDPKAKRILDAYATGLAIVVAREMGVDQSDDGLQKGLRG